MMFSVPGPRKHKHDHAVSGPILSSTCAVASKRVNECIAPALVVYMIPTPFNLPFVTANTSTTTSTFNGPTLR